MLRQYTVKHYSGLRSEMPSTLPNGDFYFAEDTGELFKYNENAQPIAVGSGPDSSSGIEFTGGFAGKPLSNNYVWEAGLGINITQADVDAEI